MNDPETAIKVVQKWFDGHLSMKEKKIRDGVTSIAGTMLFGYLEIENRWHTLLQGCGQKCLILALVWQKMMMIIWLLLHQCEFLILICSMSKGIRHESLVKEK